MTTLRLTCCGLVSCALLWAATGCGDAEDVALDSSDSSLRSALARSTDELELTDLVSRRAIGERMLEVAREQAGAGEFEQIAGLTDSAPIDAVASVDAERAGRALEPLIAAALRSEEQTTTLRAAGTRELFAADRLVGAAPDPAIRVDSTFAGEPCEALGGRSESQVVADLSGLLSELGRAADPAVASWVVVRRSGLRAGVVFLASEGVVELNPSLIYYWSPLGQPATALATAPSAVSVNEGTAPANDWEVLMRWLGQADPTSWTNLGGGASQTGDAGSDDWTQQPNPATCPCCFCSALGAGSSPLTGALALLAIALPAAVLLVVRRRAA